MDSEVEMRIHRTGPGWQDIDDVDDALRHIYAYSRASATDTGVSRVRRPTSAELRF